MASQIETLKQCLLELLNILRLLSTSQLQMIVSFDRREETFSPDETLRIINNCDNTQLETLLKISQLSPTEIAQQKNLVEENFVKSLTSSQIGAIGFVYRTYLLQEMIQTSLSIDLLMKIVEITPYKGFPDHQLQFLQQFQQLLGHLMPNTIQSLHDDANTGEGEELQELLEDHPDQYLLYQPLRSLLRLDFEDVSQFYESFPKFRSLQLVQLVRLMQLDPLNILEIRQLLCPKGWMGLQNLMMENEMMDDDEISANSTNPFVSLTILEQPSDQTVYKRNLKPHPTVMVTGDERKVLANDECLVVVPILYRCDNLSPVPKLTGDAPIKITSGNTAKFKKLKIMITSRQMADTLFCLRFELRKQKIGQRNPTSDQYETITFAQSNPILVVSHSTLMKKTSPAVQPTISEIIPSNGSSSGGNRVVIIGTNFVESPVLRVRFDNIDVTPDFHGSGTLICTAPQHLPGPVSVSVSNDGKTWSDTSATYVYHLDHLDSDAHSSVITEEYDTKSSYHGMEKSIFDSVIKLDHSFFRNMSNHVPPDLNFVDARGFAPLHYAAVTGDVAITHFLLCSNADVNIRDNFGNTALHWAALAGNVNLITLLVYFGSPLNIPNNFGETPLHLAISSQQHPVAEFLIKCGANVNAPALQGRTPLHYASVLSEHLVTLLLENGAYVNFTDVEGESPLHYATRECSLPIANLLLQYQACADLQNEDGETPLHFAVISEDLFFVNNLLNISKFDLNVRDTSGVTPVQLALESGHFSITEQLTKRGAVLPSLSAISFSSSPAESLTYLLKNLNLNTSTAVATSPTTQATFGVNTVPQSISV